MCTVLTTPFSDNLTATTMASRKELLARLAKARAAKKRKHHPVTAGHKRGHKCGCGGSCGCGGRAGGVYGPPAGGAGLPRHGLSAGYVIRPGDPRSIG